MRAEDGRVHEHRGPPLWVYAHRLRVGPVRDTCGHTSGTPEPHSPQPASSEPYHTLEKTSAQEQPCCEPEVETTAMWPDLFSTTWPQSPQTSCLS